jgi:glycosyltransferase involved in cell wall biosynthesis
MTILSPIRILYFTNTLGAGGAERQLLYLLRGLDRTRYAPAVLTIYGESHLAAHYKPDLEALNIPIYSLEHGSGLQGRLSALARYAALMWRFRPHIVQGVLHYANLIARVMRPFSPPHALITSVRERYTPNQLRSERLTHWLNGTILLNSAGLLDHMAEGAHLPRRKLRVIPNAIPLERFAEPPAVALRPQLAPDAAFVAVMVARIDPVKDHATLLRALHLLNGNLPRNFKLILVGEVSVPAAQAEITRLIGEYGLDRYVVQHPPTRDIAPYYHAADVSILPSQAEAFPNVVLESFAAGRPVVVSAAANGVNIVEHERTGWVFPTGDAAALARVLESVWRTPPADLHQMGERARAAIAPYTIHKLIENYTALYESLLGRRK